MKKVAFLIKKAALLPFRIDWQGDAKEWIVKTVGDDVIPAWRQPLGGGNE